MTRQERYAAACSLIAACRAEEAEVLLRKLLQETPDQPDLLNALAVVVDLGGDCHAAAELALQAVSLSPGSGEFRYNLGNILRRCGDFEGAEDAYLASIHAEPSLAEPYHGLGSLYLEKGWFGPAESALRKAVQIKPGLAPAQHDLGRFCQETGRTGEAEQHYRAALESDSTFPPALNALGMLLLRQNRPDEATDCFQKAINADPGYLQARCNQAVLDTWQGRLEQAIAELNALTLLAPDDGDIHFNLSLALLSAGRMEEGFKEHEWRFNKASAVPLRHFEVARWSGEPLQGKNILIHAEQGYGDSIQFIRYADMLAASGATVIVEGQDRNITPLLATAPGVSAVLSRGEPLPFRPDYQIPMMSLPFSLGVSSWPPPRPPYLKPHRELLTLWRGRVAGLPGLKVGLAWAGRQEHENDANRSIPAVNLSNFRDLQGISWVSLQFGPQAAAPDLPLYDLSAKVKDFLDSAALVSCLDLVITVDSAVAHLAGSLGMPVWLLLPWNPDWRWMRDRQDTEWYPSMRIFRQKQPGDWGEVLEAVVAELTARSLTSRTEVSVCPGVPPIVLIHYGDSDYLQFTIAQARYANPTAPIVLIGDEHTADKYPEITHIHFRPLSARAFAFARTYRHLNTNHEVFERFCLMRWFILLELMRRYGFSRAVYIDSDVLLYDAMEQQFRRIEGYDLAITGVAPPVLVNNLHVLESFCSFAEDCYRDEQLLCLLTGHFSALQQAREPGGVCDMTIWKLFMERQSEWRIIDLASSFDDLVFDRNIMLSNGFQLDGPVKKIIWKEGVPYGLGEDGRHIRFASLHFHGPSKAIMRDYLAEGHL